MIEARMRVRSHRQLGIEPQAQVSDNGQWLDNAVNAPVDVDSAGLQWQLTQLRCTQNRITVKG